MFTSITTVQTLMRDPEARIRPGQRRYEIFKTATITSWRIALEKTVLEAGISSSLVQQTVLLFLENLSNTKELDHAIAEYLQEHCSIATPVDITPSKIPTTLSPTLSSPTLSSPTLSSPMLSSPTLSLPSSRSQSKIPIRTPPTNSNEVSSFLTPVTSKEKPSKIPVRTPPTNPSSNLTPLTRMNLVSTPLGTLSRKRPRASLRPQSAIQPRQLHKPALHYGQTLCCVCHSHEVFLICKPCRNNH
jgi:hypothetical protein